MDRIAERDAVSQDVLIEVVRARAPAVEAARAVERNQPGPQRGGEDLTIPFYLERGGPQAWHAITASSQTPVSAHVAREARPCLVAERSSASVTLSPTTRLPLPSVCWSFIP